VRIEALRSGGAQAPEPRRDVEGDVVQQRRRVDPVVARHLIDGRLEADDGLGQVVTRPAEVSEVVLVVPHARPGVPGLRGLPPAVSARRGAGTAVAVSFGGRGIIDRWRMRRATLPWRELEAEAARQGCSAADIFFDRAGRAEPARIACVDDGETPEGPPPRVAWRGYDPLPARRAG
jgi:hypothetical protein